MRGLCREMFPAMKASFQTITPYWGTFDEDETRRQLAEADCDLTISDYLTDTWRKQPTLYGINHPTQPVVFEMFRRLCEKTGWDYNPDHQNDPIAWGRRALPASTRSFTPHDAASMQIKYPCDTHWYGSGYKLLNLALKAQEREAAEAQAS